MDSKAKEILLIAFEKGYRVDKEGQAFNSKGGFIKPQLQKNGYLKFNVRTENLVQRVRIHRLQAFQKFGEKIFLDGIHVRHLNGIKTDNSWDNIDIGNQSENMLDIPKDVRLNNSIYASSFVKKHNKDEIIEYYNKVKSYKLVMQKFNISSKGTLHYLLNK